MEARRVGPFRILPARVRTSLEYLEYTMSIEHGCGRSRLSRPLDKPEYRAKQAALGCLTSYLMGEQDWSDVVYVGVPVTDDMIAETDLFEVRASDEEGPLCMMDGDDNA